MRINQLPLSPNLKTVEIYIEEWGGDIFVRQLSAGEMKRLQQLAVKGVDLSSKNIKDVTKLDDFKYALVACGWVDENGNQVLSSDDDRKKLEEQPFVIIEKIANAIGVLNGLLEDADAKEKLEAIRKN
jgi:hypothetical protein